MAKKKVTQKKVTQKKVTQKKVTTKKGSKKLSPARANIRVENVVASASVDAEIDLDKVAATLPNSEYEPEQFPGLVLRLQDPKAAVLVFSSGKMVCTGAKNEEQIKQALKKTVKQVRTAGIKVGNKIDITIVNIVASSDIGTELNLDKVAFSLQNAEFEPEQFPGLVYRVFDPKVVFLLFRSGKIVCTGAKRLEDLDRGIDKLIQDLKDIKALK